MRRVGNPSSPQMLQKQTMRCCWRASLSALVLLRRASCFVVVAPAAAVPSQASRPSSYSTNTGHLRALGTRHDQGASTLRRPTWRSRSPTGAGVGGRQAINSRSPDLDADTATDAFEDPAEPKLSLLQGMEPVLDMIGASTQWVVAGSVGAALVTRADPETLVWVVGSLFNAVFSKVLKKGINQVRPDGSRLKDPGMPSSHAMSLFYLGTYLIIGLQEHEMLSAGSAILPYWPLGVVSTQALLAFYAVTASLWRVKAGFHTLPQVSVGAVVGALDAALWYNFCRGGLTSQVEAFFGGPEVPTGVTIGLCIVTFLTFGNAQRRIAQALQRREDTKQP